MAGDRSIQLRVQEIVNNSPVPINVHDALEQVLRERFGDDLDALRKWAASAGVSSMKGLRKRTYELPEADDQGSLFDVPTVIGIITPEGDLLIPKDQANTGHVRQWTKEGLQHHATQRLRFKRAVTDLETLSDVADEVLWSDARKTLAERKQKELETEE